MPLNNDKSQIDSFSVSLGQAPVKKNLPAHLEPWNILVCSDLGFVSKKPVSVHIAEWNEFMVSAGVVLSGNVRNALFDDDKQFFVEYPVKTMKDFSAESVTGTVPAFAAWAKVCNTLQQLLDGKTGLRDAITLIGKAGVSPEESSKIIAMLTPVISSRPQKPVEVPRTKPKGSSVDRILSMVDVTRQSAKSADADPASLTEALFKSVSSDEGQFDKSKITAYLTTLTQKLRDQAAAVVAQDFFKNRSLSWQGLTQLAKVIGRKKEVTLSVMSCPALDMTERLEEALGACMEAGTAPDLVVWDYEVTFTNASMEALAAVAAAAERYKCLLIAPLDMDDLLLKGISSRNSILHFFDDVRFLPYKKLRDNTASRCLCICAPSFASGISSEWFAAIRWVEMIINDNDPFGVKERKRPEESVFTDAPVFSQAVFQDVATEAARMGISLFEQTLDKATLDKAVTVAGPDSVADHFRSFCFNLLVNRAARLSGMKILEYAHKKTKDETATVLAEFLNKELSSSGISSSSEPVSVSVENNEHFVITVNSNAVVSGNPARFTFTI
jgi:predicted component of type VI protein secretion system